MQPRNPLAAFCFASAGLASLWLTAPTPLAAADSTLIASPHAGETFAELRVGTRTYTQVVVRTVSARTLSFTHAGGLASVNLRELSPELQTHFGYDPAAAAAAERLLEEKTAEMLRRQRAEKQREQVHRTAVLQSKYERLIQTFGTAPAVRPEVDLRPRFFQLNLFVKDQGLRPSCSVFAVVSALEYLNAELSGNAEKLSEEYLIWATRKATHRTAAPGDATAETATAPEPTNADKKDAGFSLGDVVTALRGYGIPLQSSMPNTFGLKMGDIADPAPSIVEEARSRRRVSIHGIPGTDTATAIANLVHALNAGIPIPIGLRWPHYSTLRTGYLNEQKPILDYAHAVTLVGYRCPTGKLADTIFVFKNSYGHAWGQAGYGFVSARYLLTNLLGAALIEMQPGAEAPAPTPGP